MAQDILGSHNWGICYKQLVNRDDNPAKHLEIHQPLHTVKNYPAPNVNSAKIDISSSNVSKD